MSEIRFDGRVAIVSGAGGGVGRTYALDLAKRGAKVVVNDLGGSVDGVGTGSAAADAVVEEIKAAGGEAVANYDSVSTMEGGQSIVQTALDNYGTVDILINNAGILRDRSFFKMTADEWDLVVSVHLRGAFCLTQPAAKVMKDNLYGRIIFTASTSGLYGNFGQTNYGAAKLGLVGIMNTLKLEAAKYNIMVNTVAPNAYSRMTADIFGPDLKDKLRPEFNTPMVTYLCSEECQVSGMTFTMSGGWFARSAVVSNAGVGLVKNDQLVTAEEIRDNFDKISDLTENQTFNSGTDIFMHSMGLIS